MNYSFHPAARVEHLDRVGYYEEQRRGLGARYLREVAAALERVCEAPQRYPIERAPAIRRARIRCFPLKLIFRTAGDTIQVLALMHYRQRPSYWLARLPMRGP